MADLSFSPTVFYDRAFNADHFIAHTPVPLERLRFASSLWVFDLHHFLVETSRYVMLRFAAN